MKAKKKANWPKKTRKHKINYHKSHPTKRSLVKLKRPARSDDDDDDDDDDDVEIEKVPRNGQGVARLSYLTQKNGENMEHEIKEGVMDVEDVGRSIEENGL